MIDGLLNRLLQLDSRGHVGSSGDMQDDQGSIKGAENSLSCQLSPHMGFRLPSLILRRGKEGVQYKYIHVAEEEHTGETFISSSAVSSTCLSINERRRVRISTGVY